MTTRYLIKNSTLSGVPVFHDTETGKWIPMDEGNMDYLDYLSWLADGNEPDEWTEDATQ